MANGPQQYQLAFEDRKGYLYAHVTADEISEETALEYLATAIDRCRQTNNSRLMIFRDVPVMLTTGSLFFVAKRFHELTEGIKVAFVSPHPLLLEELDFAAMVGTNRGAEYRAFGDPDAAEAWLLS
jgi:hypothetical protein